MRKILILLTLFTSLSVVLSTPEEGELPLNPLDHPEDMPYRWCVKHEKNNFTRRIFKSFLDVKNYMRKNDLAYIYIQDCFLDEQFYNLKYRRVTRLWRKDNIHGNVYDINTSN